MGAVYLGRRLGSRLLVRLLERVEEECGIVAYRALPHAIL
jgi:hypothetical protein